MADQTSKMAAIIIGSRTISIAQCISLCGMDINLLGLKKYRPEIPI